MIVCSCCKEEKTTTQYSWNTKKKTYSNYCKECGTWLSLFIKEANEKVDKHKLKGILVHKVNKPAYELQQAMINMIGNTNGIR